MNKLFFVFSFLSRHLTCGMDAMQLSWRRSIVLLKLTTSATATICLITGSIPWWRWLNKQSPMSEQASALRFYLPVVGTASRPFLVVSAPLSAVSSCYKCIDVYTQSYNTRHVHHLKTLVKTIMIKLFDTFTNIMCSYIDLFGQLLFTWGTELDTIILTVDSLWAREVWRLLSLVIEMSLVV